MRVGFASDCGITWLLARVTALSTALRMVETGDVLDAEESCEDGLIDVLVDEGKARVSTLDELLDYETVAATMSAHTEDAREETAALVEK